MTKPVAAIISDVHYNLTTLPLADAAMRMAISTANTLRVPLIVAGDLHDTKANIRGECMNALLRTFALLDPALPCFILRGNHDAINEKSEEHSLGFLIKEEVEPSDCYDGWERAGRKAHTVIDEPGFTNEIAVNGMSVHLIPYQHDPVALRAYLKTIDKGSCIIMHQGLTGSDMGDYIQDKSAISVDDVAGFRVISGHYHTRQTIKLPEGGLFDYVGNPFTLTYAEASDPVKGYQILYNDGSLKFVPTNLRTHRKSKLGVDKRGLFDRDPLYHTPGPDDLVWVTVEGPSEYLAHVTKETVAKYLDLRQSFKLDLVPLDTNSETTSKVDLTDEELVDSVIDGLSNTSDECKIRLKSLWRNLGD